MELSSLNARLTFHNILTSYIGQEKLAGSWLGLISADLLISAKLSFHNIPISCIEQGKLSDCSPKVMVLVKT